MIAGCTTIAVRCILLIVGSLLSGAANSFSLDHDLSLGLHISVTSKRPDQDGKIFFEIENRANMTAVIPTRNDAGIPLIGMPDFSLKEYNKNYRGWISRPMRKGSYLQSSNAVKILGGEKKTFAYYYEGFNSSKKYRLHHNQLKVFYPIIVPDLIPLHPD